MHCKLTHNFTLLQANSLIMKPVSFNEHYSMFKFLFDLFFFLLCILCFLSSCCYCYFDFLFKSSLFPTFLLQSFCSLHFFICFPHYVFVFYFFFLFLVLISELFVNRKMTAFSCGHLQFTCLLILNYMYLSCLLYSESPDLLSVFAAGLLF